MISRLKNILNENPAALPFLHRLEKILMSMDSQYGAISKQYGFNCTGCDDNCCFTLFYHHTLLECLCIQAGYCKLDDEEKSAIRKSAYQFNHHYQLIAAGQDRSFRRMCPLNTNNQCRLYAHRPMICRLHGIPYELHTPDKQIMHGPGCKIFDRQCHGQPYRAFNRTPLYTSMAELEKEARQALLFNNKIKLTIAQILLLLD